ncbi:MULTISPECIES: hypothetical protein [unclassified Acinetobacter]|uniref:hypothetical protein n=1 Tax=unclassified Acinetobacter TaxID=196816 RepID=UPI0019098C9A|nr:MULTISPECIES: hypothetical protein [unclassified Acinetobacter]MBK0062372.1 hypothetical protein [Acinetobacter sp. S55]MBK0066176.1 hypothetical protein [Acinetobacter sp. S54]
MNAIFKIGDSFAVPVQFYDTESDSGMTITGDMVITARIINAQNQTIAEPQVTVYPDQQQDAGMILLEVPISQTALWKEGTAQMDIKLEMNGNVRHSQNISFRIVRSITA